MNTSSYRRPGTRTPLPPITSIQVQAHSQPQLQRAESSTSDSSGSSQVTALSAGQRSPYAPQQPASRPALGQAPSSSTSTTSLQSFSRSMLPPTPTELPSRKNSPLALPDVQRHRPRQHSQGFFEPSLPTASLSDHSALANLTASQIAAQAAMQQQAAAQHIRKRSQTVPNPQSPTETSQANRQPSTPPATQDTVKRLGHGGVIGQHYHNGLLGGLTTAATTAANAAFPRHPHLVAALSSSESQPEREQKLKSEKSKMKLFSKPKHIGISRDKDPDKKEKPMGSPNRMGPPGPSGLSKAINASSTSLVESIAPGPSPYYMSANGSTSTLVPSDRQVTFEKEKAHKHHFLSRQKNKLKDKDDHHLPLSSASSNSRPLDPSAPQSLYSFAPASPSAATFAKSMSGLDLRHGGRALRERKKEEKASAAATTGAMTVDTSNREPEGSHAEKADWFGPSSFSATTGQSFLAAATSSNASIFGSSHNTLGGDALSQPGLQGFGLVGMTPDDAWDFLKAKLFIIFEGEDLRLPVEDFNRLVRYELYHQPCSSLSDSLKCTHSALRSETGSYHNNRRSSRPSPYRLLLA